jgi:hypothetical protein
LVLIILHNLGRCLGNRIFVIFVIWELRSKEPIVNLRVLANRNFAVGTALIAAMGLVLYGTIALLPLFFRRFLVTRRCKADWQLVHVE